MADVPAAPEPMDTEGNVPSIVNPQHRGLRPYKPGQSGNPLGKAGVLAKRIRHATQQGKTIREFLIGVMDNPKESTKHRLTAAAMLLDRGWGRPLSMLAGAQTPAATPDPRQLHELLTGLTAAELAVLVSIAGKLAARNIEVQPTTAQPETPPTTRLLPARETP